MQLWRIAVYISLLCTLPVSSYEPRDEGAMYLGTGLVVQSALNLAPSPIQRIIRYPVHKYVNDTLNHHTDIRQLGVSTHIVCNQLQKSGIICARGAYHAYHTLPDMITSERTPYTSWGSIYYWLGCASGFCSAHFLEPCITTGLNMFLPTYTEHTPYTNYIISISRAVVPPVITWLSQQTLAYTLSRQQYVRNAFNNGVELGVDISDLNNSEALHDIIAVGNSLYNMNKHQQF